MWTLFVFLFTPCPRAREVYGIDWHLVRALGDLWAISTPKNMGALRQRYAALFRYATELALHGHQVVAQRLEVPARLPRRAASETASERMR